MGVQLAHHVAFRDDAATPSGADHHHGADVLLGQAGQQFADRRVGVDRRHRRALVSQDVRDPHQGLQPAGDLLHTRLRLTRSAERQSENT